jgi:type II secretory pathway component PulF
MKSFAYKGFDRSGAKVSGDIRAEDLNSARVLLQTQGILIQQLKPQQLTESSFGFQSAKLKLADLELLTSELSVLLDAGLKIDKGIDILSESNKKPALAKLLDSISSDLKNGKQFSEAVARFSDVFGPLYINLIRIGESTGQLAEIFRRLASDLSFRRDLSQKITQALTYPMVIFLVCISSVLFIFNFVVPNLSKMFVGQEDLPVYTRLLMSSSEWLIQYQGLLGLALLAGGFMVVKFWKNPGFQEQLQLISLKLPVLRSSSVLIERIRFNSGLAIMLQSGVSIDTALELSMGNVRNRHIRHELAIAISKIKRGEQLSASLKQTCLYPDIFASLLTIGEESGELARIFEEITQRSQREFSNWVVRLTSLLEPLMILVMGAIVGGVVVVMMLSITSSSGAAF